MLGISWIVLLLIALALVFDFLNVATALGNEVLSDSQVKLSVTLAALIASIVWNIITWWLGIPSSSSHTLVGGLVGAAVVENDWGVVKLAGLGKVVLGGPVSTTQVVSSAIMGVGSAECLSKVRWGTAGQIVIAWLTTIPFAAILAAGPAIILRRWL